MKRRSLLALAIFCLVLPPTSLSQVDSTKAAPEPVSRAAEGVKPPRVIFAPDPEYPKKVSKHKEGNVTLSVLVGSDGLPKDIKVSSGLSPEFDKAAVEAVRKWKFAPGTRDGKPVMSPVTVMVGFRFAK